MLNTAAGNQLVSYREQLKADGIGFRDVKLDIKPSPDRRYTLPTGVTKPPCIRLGDTDPFKTSAGLKTALVAHYLAN